jgi:hypothetical protein
VFLDLSLGLKKHGGHLWILGIYGVLGDANHKKS